jgi:hypothetical protein
MRRVLHMLRYAARYTLPSQSQPTQREMCMMKFCLLEMKKTEEKQNCVTHEYLSLSLVEYNNQTGKVSGCMRHDYRFFLFLTHHFCSLSLILSVGPCCFSQSCNYSIHSYRIGHVMSCRNFNTMCNSPRSICHELLSSKYYDHVNSRVPNCAARWGNFAF